MTKKEKDFYNSLLPRGNVDNVHKKNDRKSLKRKPGDPSYPEDSPRYGNNYHAGSDTGCQEGYSRRTIIMKKETYEIIKYFSKTKWNSIYRMCEMIFEDYLKKGENKAILQAAKQAIKKGLI